ncbi:MAG: hypothetical protein N3D18_09660 [Roseococcus sp.]|nr:hypothetical protein [Roseococcus sp.]
MTSPPASSHPARALRAPEHRRRYDHAPDPLGGYILRGASGLGFMMFIFWLAGFGS